MKDNDVELGRVKADQSDVGGERDRHTEGGDLNLWQYVLHLNGDFDLWQYVLHLSRDLNL